MSEIKTISPKKLVSVRGSRTRKEIADASGGRFSEQDIYNWEKGLNLPRPDRLPYLVKALGTTFDDISESLLTELSA